MVYFGKIPGILGSRIIKICANIKLNKVVYIKLENKSIYQYFFLLKYIKNLVLLYFHSSKIEKAVLFTFTGVIFYYTYLYFYSSTWFVYFVHHCGESSTVDNLHKLREDLVEKFRVYLTVNDGIKRGRLCKSQQLAIVSI